MINKLKAQLDNTKKIDDFLQVSSDMNLSDENKIDGLLYYLLRKEKINIETIKPNHKELTGLYRILQS